MPLPPSEPPIDPSPQDTAKPSAPGVTLLVPAFNEENGIEGVVRRLAALDLGVPTEVLVVEDGSSDGTGAKLEQLQKEIPALRVLKHDTNRGYGASLKTGFESACTEVVVITDADDTYPEDRIAEEDRVAEDDRIVAADLIACGQPEGGLPVAQGARRRRGAKTLRGDPGNLSRRARFG